MHVSPAWSLHGIAPWMMVGGGRLEILKNIAKIPKFIQYKLSIFGEGGGTWEKPIVESHSYLNCCCCGILIV